MGSSFALNCKLFNCCVRNLNPNKIILVVKWQASRRRRAIKYNLNLCRWRRSCLSHNRTRPKEEESISLRGRLVKTSGNLTFVYMNDQSK